MTRHVTLFCVLLMALLGTSACGDSPPTLPPDSPSEVYTQLSSGSATDFLNQITTYPWDDDGAAAGARFTWIGSAAASPDRSAASHADQSAAVLADFLLTDHKDLISVSSGFLGMTKVPAAQLNPLLIRSYAQALAPYLNRMVGGDDAAFDSLRSKISDDPLALRDLLSVFMADPEAGRTIAQAADDAAVTSEDAAAAAPPDSDESVADLTAAGSLLGAVAGAVNQTGTSDVATPTIGEALNDTSVRIATALVRTDPNPGTLSKYLRGGQLMAPPDVEREFTQDEMRTYFLSLRSYLTEKGLGEALDAFQDAFRASSGDTSQ